MGEIKFIQRKAHKGMVESWYFRDWSLLYDKVMNNSSFGRIFSLNFSGEKETRRKCFPPLF